MATTMASRCLANPPIQLFMSMPDTGPSGSRKKMGPVPCRQYVSSCRVSVIAFVTTSNTQTKHTYVVVFQGKTVQVVVIEVVAGCLNGVLDGVGAVRDCQDKRA